MFKKLNIFKFVSFMATKKGKATNFFPSSIVVVQSGMEKIRIQDKQSDPQHWLSWHVFLGQSQCVVCLEEIKKELVWKGGGGVG
jgi:hypothetical protein